MSQDDLKKQVGEAAAGHVKNGMVVGLGTGSTVHYTILKLGERVKDDGLNIIGIPTSRSTESLALELGIELGTLAEHRTIDLTIDGADEVDPHLNLIKGMGGALLREKVVAFMSREEIIVADESKVVKVLGTRSPLPVEVLPFALPFCLARLEEKCSEARVRKVDGSDYITDNGNNIIDCRFDGITQPETLERELDRIPGVVGNGLFLGLATHAMIGKPEGVVLLRPI